MLLSDVDGLYSADPNLDPAAEFFPEVRGITPRIEAMAGGSASDVGSGGMATKIARRASRSDAGCYMCIAAGHPQNPLRKVESRCALHLVHPGRHAGGRAQAVDCRQR